MRADGSRRVPPEGVYRRPWNFTGNRSSSVSFIQPGFSMNSMGIDRHAEQNPQEVATLRGRLLTGVRDWYQALLHPLGTIFFVSAPRSVFLLWIALALQPRFAAFALAGQLVGAGVAYILRVKAEVQLGGSVQANALLTALMVAWITGHAGLSLPAQIGLAVFSAASAAIVAAAITQVLSRTPLPSLVWGYCVVASILCCTLPAWSMLAADAMEPWPLPTGPTAWILIYVRSLGSVIYSPSLEAGLLVGIAVLLWSRTMLIAGLIGWLGGTCLAMAFTQFGVEYFWQAASYNSLLAGMALGSVYFLPGRSSLLVAAAGGCGASFFALGIQHLLQYSASSYLPIPAGLTIWVGIGALTLIRERGTIWPNFSPSMAPEAAWWDAAYWARRFGVRQALLTVPLDGRVRIVEGFDGEHSHAGLIHHALDMQRCPATGEGNGSASTWGALVTAPAAGIVERAIGHLPDNLSDVGHSSGRLGNHVVIHLDQGAWVTLAHLQQRSVALATGIRVDAGTPIGRVGSSGRSSVPHLHLHVQGSPDPESPTIPFRLANYQSVYHDEADFLEWHAAYVPHVGDVIEAARPNPVVYELLVSMVPGRAVWTVDTDGEVPREYRTGQPGNGLTLDIKSDEQGRLVFEASNGDRLITALAPDAWRLIELNQGSSSFLKLLAYGTPSIPYSATRNMTWKDPVPVRPAGWWRLMTAPYRRQQFQVASCTCLSLPSDIRQSIEISTRLQPGTGLAPSRMTCEIASLHGPIKLHAVFAAGSLTFRQISFEPEKSVDT